MGRLGTTAASLSGELRLDRRLLGAFAVSRAVVLLAALAAETVLPRNPALTSGDGAPILRSLTGWDGWFYLGIVRDGYHALPVSGAYHDYAFFPLFPLVVRLLSLPWPAFAGLVAVAVSNVALLVGLGLLARLGEPILGRERSSLAVAYLAIFPFAAVFSMAYTESLFLALSLAAFLAAERDRRAWTGVLFALAALCRLQGVVLIVPLALIFLRRDGWRLRLSQIWLLMGPLATLSFLGYTAVLAGGARGYLDAQTAWGRSGVGGSAPGRSLLDLLSPYNASLLLVLCLEIFLLVYIRPDRIPLAYALVPILYLAAALSSGLLEAIGRIAMLAFPYCWILAGRRSVAFRRAWPAISVMLLAVLATTMFRGYYVP